MRGIKSILIVCISLVSELAFSQPMFTNGRSSSDSLREEGDLTGAIAEFKNIYARNPLNQNNVYNYACALSLDRQFDSCFKYLTIAVGLDTSSASLVDPDFLPVRKDKGWEGFEKKLISMRNQKELEELIAKKGWPKNSAVGSTAAGAAFYVIQHSDVEKQKKYVPMLKQRCEEKEASWQNYAMLYDRLQMNKNKPQKYGTQTSYNEKTDSVGL